MGDASRRSFLTTALSFAAGAFATATGVWTLLGCSKCSPMAKYGGPPAPEIETKYGGPGVMPPPNTGPDEAPPAPTTDSPSSGARKYGGPMDTKPEELPK